MLHWAAEDGHLEVVKRLVEARANNERKNNDEETVLDGARKKTRYEWDPEDILEKRRSVIDFLVAV